MARSKATRRRVPGKLRRSEVKARQKGGVVEEVKQLADQFTHLYIFRTSNMRNAQLKELREDLKPENRFYMGRKSLVRVALGRNKTEAIKDNIHLVSQMLDKMKNECGLLFSNEDPETLAEKIQSFQVPDFARAGFLPTKRISLDAGPLPQFQGTQEPMLRKMGLKTTLKKGVVHLEESYLAAEPGVPLTPDQAHLLKLLGLHLAIFKVELVCHYEDGSFESLIDDEDDDDDEIPSDD